MPSLKRIALVGSVATLGALGSISQAAPARSSAAAAAGPLANAHALLKSRELWATIDVCSPTDQPDTVGIRGSMPGDGHAGDRVYMSFRLQYLSPSQQWTDVAGALTPFASVGGGASSREGGSSFQLVPVAGRPAAELRGVVDFQWRRGRKILLTAVKASTGAHKSVAGADPAGFSAATCSIG